jgi:hypothetical protein
MPYRLIIPTGQYDLGASWVVKLSSVYGPNSGSWNGRKRRAVCLRRGPLPDTTLPRASGVLGQSIGGARSHWLLLQHCLTCLQDVKLMKTSNIKGMTT